MAEKRKAGRPPGSKSLGYKNQKKVTPSIKNKFLRAIANGSNVLEASEHLGISRASIYAHLRKDPKFKELYDLALEKRVECWENELTRRAMEGLATTEYDGEGKVIKKTVKEDVNSLTRVLEANSPDKWAPKKNSQTEVNINHNGESSAVNRLAQMLGVSLPKPDTVEGEFTEVKDDKPH